MQQQQQQQQQQPPPPHKHFFNKQSNTKMKKNGIFIFILGCFAMGLRAQEKTSYWDNGNLRNVSNYIDGEKEGQNIDYYQNGQLEEIGDYKNGEKNGEWKRYYKAEQLKSITQYKDGKLHGERKDYHKNGELEFVLNYKDGEAIGASKSYNENGKLLNTTSYKNGDWFISDNTERRLVEFNVAFIESSKIEELQSVTANYISRTDLILKTVSNSDYSYAFGLKEKLFENKLVKSLTILLLKGSEVISEISYNIDFEYKDIFEYKSLKGFNIEGADETLEIGFGRGACGYGYHSTVFFRKNDELVKGVLVSSYGEAESEYNTQEIIAPLNNEPNQVWVKNKTGHSEYLNEEYTEVNYFTEIKKYTFQQGKFILTNPKKDNFYYVNAVSGLRQRYRPSITSDILSLLKYGTRVKLLNKTNHRFKVSDNGKIVDGYWVLIEAKDASGNTYISYVFDGYLSKNLTDSNDTQSINNSKNGTWEWYYDNGQLGELGFYKNDKKDGEWKWYFKNGALKAIGSYKNGQPEGIRKWYHSNENLYCIGQYSDGKKDGEWKWYTDQGRLRNGINFNKGTVVKYVVFDKQGEIVFKNSGSSATKVIFEESYSYLNVFDLRITEQNGYRVGFVGSIYIGKNKDNKATGEWKIYHNDGTLYKIKNYKKGKLHGEFQQFNKKEILKYLWNFKNDEKTGLYKEYYDNGQIKNKGYLKNGKLVGKGKSYHKNGQINSIQKYRNNKLNGNYISYYNNGELKENGNYTDGNKEVEWKSYYENGKLKEVTPYKNGKIHGEWTVYDDEGILKERMELKDGDFTKLHKTDFYPNGQIKAIGFTNNDKQYGVWKKYYIDGKLEEVNNYKEGRQDGKKSLYYKSGSLKFEGQHVKGKMDGKFIWYQEDGKIQKASELKYDSKYIMGEWRYYNNGQLKSVELYQRDELVEWKYYYNNGQLKELRQYYKKRIRTGEWKYYYKSGELRLITHYKDGIPLGEFKLYHKNGQLYKTQIWRHYKKLMEINSCFDAKGNILDKGTLKKGTGTVKEYNAKGDLLNTIAYVDGKQVNNSKSVDEVWLDSSKLNSLAWKVYKGENSKETLNFAIKWIKQSIDLDENYHNTDTYAALLYKTAKYKQALSIAEKAIAIAEKRGSKFKATEALIEKINMKLESEKE